MFCNLKVGGLYKLRSFTLHNWRLCYDIMMSCFSVGKDIIFPEHGLTWTVENRDASCYIVSDRQNKHLILHW